MESWYPDNCEEFSVTPVLMAPCYPSLPSRCCDEPPICYPCLPRCHKPAIVYCGKRTKPRPRFDDDDDCCDGCDERKRRPSPSRHKRAPTSQSATNCCHSPPICCPTCCQPSKPVRTKYVIPCYRYEDGRINQPTVLMRRACEVACGVRSRHRPFVESSYSADPCGEFHRYHCEDERGNICFHMERKPTRSLSGCAAEPCCHPVSAHHPCHSCTACPCNACASSPSHWYATDCVHARVVDPPRC